MIKIIHLITDLHVGGAEFMLYRLLKGMDKRYFRNEVISLTDLGPLAEKLRDAEISVRALGMKPGVPNAFALFRLARWIRDSKPHIVQTWMYHSNLVGALAARLGGDVPVVWGIHQADMDPRWNKPLTIWTSKACAQLSRWLPSGVVFVSQASLCLHTQLGYATRKMGVIPNGFDTQEFKPDPRARQALRNELGVADDALLIGMAARFHPQKDHRNFIQAAALLHTVEPDVHFAMCGLGITRENAELMRWIREAGIEGNCHLLGPRHDVPRFFAAVDIATSSAISEAFPLSVGEAMACGTPCVVTDVGDSALIVGMTGRVVPPGDPDALAAAWRELLQLGSQARRELGTAARFRIQKRFSLPVVLERYQSLYAQLASETHQGVPATRLAHPRSSSN